MDGDDSSSISSLDDTMLSDADVDSDIDVVALLPPLGIPLIVRVPPRRISRNLDLPHDKTIIIGADKNIFSRDRINVDLSSDALYSGQVSPSECSLADDNAILESRAEASLLKVDSILAEPAVTRRRRLFSTHPTLPQNQMANPPLHSNLSLPVAMSRKRGKLDDNDTFPSAKKRKPAVNGNTVANGPNPKMANGPNPKKRAKDAGLPPPGLINPFRLTANDKDVEFREIGELGLAADLDNLRSLKALNPQPLPSPSTRKSTITRTSILTNPSPAPTPSRTRLSRTLSASSPTVISPHILALPEVLASSIFPVHLPAPTKPRNSSPNRSPHRPQRAGASQKSYTNPYLSGNDFDGSANEHNEDHCSTCLMTEGKLLCCESCPKSFHFECVDPPLPDGKIPSGLWECNECKAKKHTSRYTNKRLRSLPSSISLITDGHEPLNLWGELLYGMETMNPRVFELTSDIKDMFEGTFTHPLSGAYMDRKDIEIRDAKKPKLKPVPTRKPRRDEAVCSELLPLCYKCARSGLKLCSLNFLNSHSVQQPTPIGNPSPLDGVTPFQTQAIRSDMIKCDFCDLSWHLDCLDPPLATAPRDHLDLVDIGQVKNLRRSWGEFRGEISKYDLDIDKGAVDFYGLSANNISWNGLSTRYGFRKDDDNAGARFISIRRKWMCPCHVDWVLPCQRKIAGWQWIEVEDIEEFELINSHLIDKIIKTETADINGYNGPGTTGKRRTVAKIKAMKNDGYIEILNEDTVPASTIIDNNITNRIASGVVTAAASTLSLSAPPQFAGPSTVDHVESTLGATTTIRRHGIKYRIPERRIKLDFLQRVETLKHISSSSSSSSTSSTDNSITSSGMLDTDSFGPDWLSKFPRGLERLSQRQRWSRLFEADNRPTREQVLDGVQTFLTSLIAFQKEVARKILDVSSGDIVGVESAEEFDAALTLMLGVTPCPMTSTTIIPHTITTTITGPSSVAAAFVVPTSHLQQISDITTLEDVDMDSRDVALDISDPTSTESTAARFGVSRKREIENSASKVDSDSGMDVNVIISWLENNPKLLDSFQEFQKSNNNNIRSPTTRALAAPRHEQNLLAAVNPQYEQTQPLNPEVIVMASPIRRLKSPRSLSPVRQAPKSPT